MKSRPYKERRYSVLVLDAQGAQHYRWTVLRHKIGAIVGVCVGALVLFIALTWHAFTLTPQAREAQRLMRQNKEAAALLAEVESRLEPLRYQLLHSEQTAAQLWAMSGLGMETNMVGIGPLDGEHRWGLPDLAAPHSGSLLDTPIYALSLESDRMLSDAHRLHQTLGDTLEYFHDARRLLSNTPSVRPVQSAVTSKFGKRRDPMHSGWVMHKGLDLGGHTGMEIIAPADGVVIWTGWRGGYGQTVVLDHGYGLQTHFAHLHRYRVKQGQRIKRGEIIAEIGSTGRSTGPHLHYEVRRQGEPMDPQKFILD